MKLTYDFLTILAKYRNRVENYDLDYSEEDAIASIKKVGNRYERIAAEQRVSGYERVRDIYEKRIKAINKMVEKAKMFVLLLSEDDYATRKLVNDLLDSEISGYDIGDDIGGDAHAETTGKTPDDKGRIG